MLRAESLRCVAGGRALIDDVTLQLAPGEVLAVLGPNGAGKSSLLRALAGELRPDAGRVLLNGQLLDRITPRERARHRAVLPQSESLRFGFTVEQVVALGRFPCPQHAPAREAAICAEAMQAAGVVELAQRRYPQLSGGERARVQLARVLAQVWEPLPAPRYLLLDEPTASLDLSHQHEVLAAVRRFAVGGVGVLAVLHDPNLALAYADRALLLRQGRVYAEGSSAEVLTPAHMQAVFGIEVETLPRPGGGAPVLAARPRRP